MSFIICVIRVKLLGAVVRAVVCWYDGAPDFVALRKKKIGRDVMGLTRTWLVLSAHAARVCV